MITRFKSGVRAQGLLLIMVIGTPMSSNASPQDPMSVSSEPTLSVRSSAGGLVAYEDHASWLVAAGSTTLIDFESFPSGTEITTQLPGVDLVTGSSSFARGPVSVYVTASTLLPFPLFIPGTLPTEPNFLSNDLSHPGGSATGSTTFHVSGLATAIGGYVAGQPLDDFRIVLFVGGVNLGSVWLPPRTLPNSFVGVVSPVPFDTATFTPVRGDNSFGLDNMEHNAVEPTSVQGDAWGRVKALFR